ncbi:TfoX/Sxy family protein [Pseudomaricurvus sp.]|uniref:TfoX/Sxy family protein n=1 Tax=Pseudomaricurvus sp. TaxID=2004510 RepID=UPI003F6CF6D7
MTERHSDLLQLKNLGAASVNILHAIGVNSYADLNNMGPVEAYIRIKNRGIHVSKVMLYALQGALLDVHWNDLDPGVKQRLLEDAATQEENHSQLS